MLAFSITVSRLRCLANLLKVSATAAEVSEAELAVTSQPASVEPLSFMPS